MIDAIAFKYGTGTPWTDPPEHSGSRKGAHNRLRKWTADGTREKVFHTLLAQADDEGDLGCAVAVDSSLLHGAADEFAAPCPSKLVTPQERTAPCRSFSSTSSPPSTAMHRERDGPGSGASRARSTWRG
ncbi:transposase [Streptomyces sp. 2RAF24]|uniref:hypothetical protein n=1 Tax=unclassified Streptomyces TaxID=2593676 RepID=UPI0033DC167B